MHREPEHPLRLRPSCPEDLDFVLFLERHPDNRPFILQWSEQDHLSAMTAEDREHWIVEKASDSSPLGYIIVYNLVANNLGVYLKRIVIGEKSRQTGRLALEMVLDHAFSELGAAFVSLAVLSDNERAQRAYESIGFVDSSLPPRIRRALEEAAGGFPENSVLMCRYAD